MNTTPKVAKTQRSKRALNERASKLVENTKKLLCLRGPSSSNTVQEVMLDIHMMKAPHSKMLQKRNLTRPFEDASSLEFLCQTNDCSLFVYGSHSKKRPHNIVLGRTFDGQVLDMVEMGIDPESFLNMKDFEGYRKAVVRYASKPLMLFQGDWDSSDLVITRNLLLDLFRGDVLPKLNLVGIDRVIVVSAVEGVIHFRHYGILLKKSGTKFPRVELDEVGPRFNATIRRRKQAAPELVKESIRQPKAAHPKQKKNIETSDTTGDRMGRVHMQKQDLSNLNVARLDGLKKRKSAEAADDGEKTEKKSVPRRAATPMDEFDAADTSKSASRKKAAGYGSNLNNGEYQPKTKKIKSSA